MVSARKSFTVAVACSVALVEAFVATGAQIESQSNPIASGAIVIDGSFGDWAGIASFTADAADAAAEDQDWVRAWIAHDESNLYFRLERAPGSAGWLNPPVSGGSTGGAGYWTVLDTDKTASTGIALGGTSRYFPIGGEFLINGGSLVARYGAGAALTGTPCTLGAFAPLQTSAVQPTEVEVAIPRSELGNPTDFNIVFKGENSNDYYPNTGNATGYFYYTTAGPAGPVTPLPANAVQGFSNPVANGTMVMDGDLSDWASVLPYDPDNAGVADGGTNQDWVQCSIAHDDTYIYIRMKRTAAAVQFTSFGYWGLIDTDKNNTTGLTGATFSPAVGADFNTGGINIINQWNPEGTLNRQFNYAATGVPSLLSIEFSIPRAWIGDPADFNLMFAGESSGDYFPNSAAPPGTDYFNYVVHPAGPSGRDPLVVETRYNPLPNGVLTVDGDLADWATVTPYSPADLNQTLTPQGWVQASIAHDDTNVYMLLERAPQGVGFNFSPTGQGYWVIMDTDLNAASGMIGFAARDFSIGAEFNLSGAFAFNQWLPTGCFTHGIPFSTSSGFDAEMAIARSTLGNPADLNIAFRGETGNDLYPDSGYFHYTTGTPIAPLPAGMVQSVSNVVPNGSITANGDVSDWGGVTPYVLDTPGDGAGSEDWLQVWIAHDDDNFYLRLKRGGSSLTFGAGYWGLFDTDRNATTGFTGGNPAVGAEFNTGGIVAFNRWSPEGGYLGTAAFVAVAQSNPVKMEVSVARADLGNPEQFRVIFVGENSGDYYPLGANSKATFLYSLVTPCNTIWADSDNDSDVDMDDFGVFQACYTGPGGTRTDECFCLDRTHDGSIDGGDFEAFKACASGADIDVIDTNCGHN